TFLESLCWQVLRFWNSDIRAHPDGVADAILSTVEARLGRTHPRPLPSREGRCARIRVLAATPSPVIPAEAGISPDMRGVRHPRCRLSLA
ncbi:MAG: DUF559 domain-containing protein, partial [Sphingomonas oligoaromativorans]